MLINCWSSLASREVVPVPGPAQKPWRTLWKSMEVVRRKMRMTVTTFHTNYARPMPY